MLNKVVLMGRLTRDPELRHIPSGKSVASFSVACDRDFKSTDGQKETDFIDCVAWGATAEFVSNHFNKGSMAAIEGRLQVRSWKDKDGGNRKSVEVVASNVYFADSKRKEMQDPLNQLATAAEQFADDDDDLEGELPF